MKLNQIVKKALSYIPSQLPVGMTAFNEFSADIIALTGNVADEDSMRFVIATNIQHIKQTQDKVPKNFFVKVLRKAAANQVAAQIFYDIKQKQADATAKQQAEAAANEQQKSKEQTTQNN